MNSGNITILGMQWGDEGKGKVVDYFTDEVDIVARFGGGANAGHTVVNNRGKFVLHLLPSGMVNPDIRCYMGGGMVVDLPGLFEELDDIKAKGIKCDGRLFIDYSAHLVLPQHKAIERYSENLVEGKSINTTLRGIGPAYADKANRIGITAGDLTNEAHLIDKINTFIQKQKARLAVLNNKSLLEAESLLNFFKPYIKPVKSMLVDVPAELRKAMNQNERVLFEGSQGSLLDLSLGNYPYVTSSNTTIGGLFTGLGVPPGVQGEVLGVVKAYTTRVGNGPFPSELYDATGKRLRETGGEYGATTGRPRRCGWLDTAIVKRTAYMSGVTGIVITKLDVLDGLKEIKVCIGHSHGGIIYDFPMLTGASMSEVEPVYETLPGWETPTANITDYATLPLEARRYVEYIEAKIEKPIKYISTGSRREAFVKKA